MCATVCPRGVLKLENGPRDDLTQKKRTYEAAGVKEYWIVDPMAQRIEVYEHRDGRFTISSEAEQQGEVQSKVVEGFSLEVSQVFT